MKEGWQKPSLTLETQPQNLMLSTLIDLRISDSRVSVLNYYTEGPCGYEITARSHLPRVQGPVGTSMQAGPTQMTENVKQNYYSSVNTTIQASIAGETSR